MNNPSPNVQTIQPKEQPLTEPDVGGRKPPGKKARKSVLAPYETTDLTAIAKETHLREKRKSTTVEQSLGLLQHEG